MTCQKLTRPNFVLYASIILWYKFAETIGQKQSQAILSVGQSTHCIKEIMKTFNQMIRRISASLDAIAK